MSYTGLSPTAIEVSAPVGAQSPSANTDAVCTLAADPAACWHLRQINWSYSGIPAVNSTIVITWTDPSAGSVSETYYVIQGGPGQQTFPPRRFPIGSGVTITLLASGSNISGTIYVDAWKG